MTATPGPTGSLRRGWGYGRSAVDGLLARLRSEADELRARLAAAEDDAHRLRAGLDALREAHERLGSSSPDERSRDLLAAAERQARELVAEAQRSARQVSDGARREAEVQTERVRQELAWARRQIRQERTELRNSQQAIRHRLSSLRTLAVDSAARFPDLGEDHGRRRNRTDAADSHA